jgi:transposase
MNEGQTVSSAAGSADPEVTPKAKRRCFSAAYKKKILPAVDTAQRGGIGEVLRREGLYSSTLTEWRKDRPLPPVPDNENFWWLRSNK